MCLSETAREGGEPGKLVQPRRAPHEIRTLSLSLSLSRLVYRVKTRKGVRPPPASIALAERALLHSPLWMATRDAMT